MVHGRYRSGDPYRTLKEPLKNHLFYRFPGVRMTRISDYRLCPLGSQLVSSSQVTRYFFVISSYLRLIGTFEEVFPF